MPAKCFAPFDVTKSLVLVVVPRSLLPGLLGVNANGTCLAPITRPNMVCIIDERLKLQHLVMLVVECPSLLLTCTANADVSTRNSTYPHA